MNEWTKPSQLLPIHIIRSASRHIDLFRILHYFTYRIQFTILFQIECVNLRIKNVIEMNIPWLSNCRYDNSSQHAKMILLFASIWKVKSLQSLWVRNFVFTIHHIDPLLWFRIKNIHILPIFHMYWIDIIGTPAGIITFHRWIDHVCFFFSFFREKKCIQMKLMVLPKKKCPKIVHYYRWNCEQSGIDFFKIIIFGK